MFWSHNYGTKEEKGMFLFLNYGMKEKNLGIGSSALERTKKQMHSFLNYGKNKEK
jgi:hypothetical protein